MAHPFSISAPDYHYERRISHVYASPTMVGVFGGSPRVSRTVSGGRQSRLEIHADSSTVNGSETTLSPLRETPAARCWQKVRRSQLWRRVAYAAVSFVFIVAWVALMFVFAKPPPSFKGASVSTPPTDKPAASSLVLQGSLNTFDSSSGTMTLTWAPMMLTSDGLKPFGTTDDEKKEFGIYRDQEIVADTQHTPLSDWQGNLWKVDSNSASAIAVVGMHPWDTFSTNIRTQERQSFSGYPWDKWSGSIALVANDQEAAARAGVSNSYAVIIEDAILAGTSANWRISAAVENTCNDSTKKSCALVIEFTIQRTPLTIATSVIMIAINWAITISLLILTCEAVIMRREIIVQDLPLFLICFIALFALPAVRYVLPSAPAFGSFIDFVGLIPNLFVIAACIIMLSIHSLRPSVYFIAEAGRSTPERDTKSPLDPQVV